MTVIEQFVQFAESLDDQERRAIEVELEALMQRHGGDPDLTPAQIAELKRRMADPNPEYASKDEMEANFGHRRYG